MNGNCADWSCKEDISGQSCADASNWNDWLLPPITADTTLILQFGSCDTPSGLNENNNLSISLYPNPASDQLNVLFNNNLDRIIIRDLLGKEVINVSNIVGNNHIINIKDHINLTGNNPLIGSNLDELGPRFPDMSNVYNKELRDLAKQISRLLTAESAIIFNRKITSCLGEEQLSMAFKRLDLDFATNNF